MTNFMRDIHETDQMYEIRRAELESIQSAPDTINRISKAAAVVTTISTEVSVGDIVSESDQLWRNWQDPYA